MTDPQSDEHKSEVRRRFGAHAGDYVTSTVHAHGASLARLVELTAPQADWRVLDVATGGGHTALAFAPRVARVTAVDLTEAMLRAARAFVRSRLGESSGAAGVAFGVDFGAADAERLPFAAGAFDLLTCRIALHHFPDARGALRDWARVLRPGGLVGLADNVVPPDRVAAGFINHFEQERDPSHHWAYPLERLLVYLADAGLEPLHHEISRKPIEFEPWVRRMGASPETEAHLRERLLGASGLAREALNPREEDGRLVFDLHEAVIIARRSN
jgi:ubiquinone/menaquinone biosynthesis C-methylase UbiE